MTYASLMQTSKPTNTCTIHDAANITILHAGRCSLVQGLFRAYAASRNENSVKCC